MDFRSRFPGDRLPAEASLWSADFTRDARASGARLIVMGSLAFQAEDIARTMAWVRSH